MRRKDRESNRKDTLFQPAIHARIKGAPHLVGEFFPHTAKEVCLRESVRQLAVCGSEDRMRTAIQDR
jgi:hypothetical protein